MESLPNCPNCGSVLHGRYCSACGQDQRIAPLTLLGMLREAIQELTDVDGRVAKTLTALLFRPGRMTRDYISLRRADYLPPFRIYLIVSVVLYFVLDSLIGQVSFTIDLGDPDTLDAGQDAGGTDTGFVGSLVARLEELSESPGFGERVFGHLPEVGFVLLPIVGLLLKALYVNRRRPYGEHLLAAVHIKTGVFLIAIAAALVAAVISAIGGPGNVPRLLIPGTLLASSLYVGISLFVTYRGNMIASIARTAVLLLAYWMLASIGLLGVAVILALNST